jgi:type II secretory pathway pseudopilin PulG
VVIAVISVIAAMILPSLKGVNRIKLLSLARAEMAQLESCIECYKARLGHYPPDNRNLTSNDAIPGLNQLYYELAGTVYSNGMFTAKDNSGQPLSPAMIKTIFGTGVSGFVNTERGDSDGERVAIPLLNGFKPAQIASTTMTNRATGMTMTGRILVCTVSGTDPNVPPLNNGSPPLNPWRYISSSPTNNPNSYDLWTDIFISRKVVRICNWNSQPITVH